MSGIEVHNFSYTYPGENTPILDGLNLSVPRGSFAVITGKSGCGKSTLGKAIAGFLFQDEEPRYSGKIIINGTDMAELPLFEASKSVCYVQQNPEDQFCTLSVMDEIAFGLENNCVHPEEIDRRIDQSLKIVKGLDLKNRDLATLSGGEKQKVAIASMLALSPDVLILDEPTSNLDPMATQNIFETLHHIRNHQDLTVIIIEHKLSQLQKFDPLIFNMQAGTLQPLRDFPEINDYLKTKINKIHLQQGEPMLTLSRLNLVLGGQHILHDINLSIAPGEFIALMGPNGSGKSTLLRTIMGFHQPERGRLFGFGKDLTKTKISELVKNIGFIFQNPDHQLFTQSVWEEAVFTSKNLNMLTNTREATAREWLSKMGLESRLHDHPQRLSYGEKRRLNLIAAMLHEPKLLLIDELLIGQDPENAHAWMTLLRNYTHQGNAVLLVNHHPYLTKKFCDRVIFLDQGSIITDEFVLNAFVNLPHKGFSAFIPQLQEGLVYA